MEPIHPMASPQESNSLCLKHKRADDCLSKACKARRIKVDDGPSSDSSVKRCNCCCTRPNLASDCVNFLNSGAPNRVVFYKQGSWQNFSEQIMKSLIDEFKNGKSSIVSVMDDEPVLVDFLSMTLVNLKTRKQRSVAWFDDTGKFFSPSLFFDEEADEVANVDPGNAEGSAQGIMLDKVANSPPEVVKQVVLESSPPVPQKPSAADILRKKITSVEKGSEGFLFVRDLFLSGMGTFAAPNNILHIHRYTPNDITAQCRLEAFERQMRITKEERGDANVRYGWLGSRKNDIIKILINGLGSPGKPVEKAGLSGGVYLSPENRAFTSVGLCDVDEKGVQYMLLCRVILGNMEKVMPGSQDSFPSSEIYDSGVDDSSNPKCYVMWPSHLGTHIRLEYLVSFRLTERVRNYLLDLKGLWFHPSPKEVMVDISTLQPIMSETGEGRPTSPWISFRVLFAMIKDEISSIARELLFHHYEEMKESKITRGEMVNHIIIIVGEKILLETLKKLHYCPSLWFKPCVEESSDPAKTTAECPASSSEHISSDKTTRNCSLTLGDNHDDLHGPKALSDNSTDLGTKRCVNLATGMVPKGQHFVAPGSAPGTSISAGAVSQASPSVEPKGRNSPMQITSKENSTTCCVKKQDSFVARIAPIVRDDLLRTTSGQSASLTMEVSDSISRSIGPGCASLAPINASKSCAGFASDSSPKCSESLTPSLSLGISKCIGVKGPSPTPRLTPEGQKFLSLSSPPQSLVLCSGHKTSSPQTTEGCDSPELSIVPKGHDSPASSNKSKCPKDAATSTVPETQHCQALAAATKGYKSPTTATGEPTKKTAQRASRNKSFEEGVEASSNDARAADALVALSNPRKKCR